MISDENRYRILKALEADPSMSQRELAKKLGLSLGKVNHCVQALIEVGALKSSNFKKSTNKKGYMYVLTPKGIEEKAVVSARFLKRKLEEYKMIKLEIESLRKEVAHSNYKQNRQKNSNEQ